MKPFKMIPAILGFFALAVSVAQAATPDEEIVVQPNQVIVQVNGIVCSFCAYGTEKNLSKLKFLDSSKYGNGVLMNINTHRITLALAPGQQLDLKSVYKSIKKGGYDPVVVYLRVRGVLEQQGGQYLVLDKASGQRFELTGSKLASLSAKKFVDVQAHLDATQIPSFHTEQPIKVVVDKLEVGA